MFNNSDYLGYMTHLLGFDFVIILVNTLTLTLGQVLNNCYHIVKLLGQGCFGAGYRA